jgi:deoxyribodipyrimidine photolyase-related protein
MRVTGTASASSLTPVTTLHLILGDQLFPEPKIPPGAVVFMAEDRELCTRFRIHVHKIILFLSAMRHYADDLRAAGHSLRYVAIDDPTAWPTSYEEKILAAVAATGATRLRIVRPVDRWFAERIRLCATKAGCALEELPNPGFLTSDTLWDGWAKSRPNLRMAEFYTWQRRRLGILIEHDGSPLGGRWSFDSENREPLPALIPVPTEPKARTTEHVRAVQGLCRKLFADHPGDPRDFWLPVTRAEARSWLAQFIVERLPSFGPYEDACPARADVLWHSVLTPALNLGLIIPSEVVEAVLAAPDVDLPSREGFLRQVIGWREFIRGIDRTHGERQAAINHWDHRRRLGPAWYAGKTGVPPWDHCLGVVERRAWCHHIQRLMVLGNAMNLLEVEPRDAYGWFMERFCDSADWVMGPNVYGMALNSDGGVFATKPYICGSPYLRRMGGWPAGDWCDEVDGLYWGFIARHQAALLRNPRMAQAARGLERIGGERRARIERAALGLRNRVTSGVS